MLPKKKCNTQTHAGSRQLLYPLCLCPPVCHPGHRGAVLHRHPLTCRRHVCCCLPCSGSSSSSPSSSSLPLPAAWGSLWRFIHSCLPIGPSAFPCLPEADRVTPRPFPATFCCHRAALPQPGAAAGLGHAWAAAGRGSVPQRGVRGVGGRGHGTDPPCWVQTVSGNRSRSAPGLSALPSAFPIPTQRRCPSPLAPTEQRLCGEGPHPRPLPGQPSSFLSLSARPSILFQLVFPLPPHPRQDRIPLPERCPIPAAGRSAVSSSERGVRGRGSPATRQPRVLPTPP